MLVNKQKLLDVLSNVKSYPTIQDIADYLGIGYSTVKKYASELRREGYEIPIRGCNQHTRNLGNEELLNDMSQSKRSIQKLRDKNRISNAALREHHRELNAVESLNSELIDLLRQYDLSNKTIEHDEWNENAPVGVIQISDVHFNELVEMSNNRYDYGVAAKRLKLHVQKAKRHFLSVGVQHVLVAFTADLLNSDRRLDEIMAASTNRSKAMFIATDILRQLILDVNKHFNVSVASVCGNESRVNKDVGWIKNIVTENYDYSIHNLLAYSFKNAKGIDFAEIHNGFEQVVQIGGHNLLLIHGHTIGKKDSLEGKVSTIKTKYADQGIKIDYVIFGHIHSAYVSDCFARSGSTVGANAYSDRALHLSSRASQNYYLFWPSGNIDAIKNDLQEIDNVVGYNYQELIEEYHAKSAEKAKKTINTVFRMNV